jgi:hypothetical protein
MRQISGRGARRGKRGPEPQKRRDDVVPGPRVKKTVCHGVYGAAVMVVSNEVVVDVNVEAAAAAPDVNSEGWEATVERRVLPSLQSQWPSSEIEHSRMSQPQIPPS